MKRKDRKKELKRKDRKIEGVEEERYKAIEEAIGAFEELIGRKFILLA
jgi:hypothetical protein